jgi:hypothetical protein
MIPTTWRWVLFPANTLDHPLLTITSRIEWIVVVLPQTMVPVHICSNDSSRCASWQCCWLQMANERVEVYKSKERQDECRAVVIESIKRVVQGHDEDWLKDEWIFATESSKEIMSSSLRNYLAAKVVWTYKLTGESSTLLVKIRVSHCLCKQQQYFSINMFHMHLQKSVLTAQ